MQATYKLKFGLVFNELLSCESLLMICLKEYLEFYSLKVKEFKLIPLLKQVKNTAKDKSKKKLDNKCEEIYCELIEKIVMNFDDKDLKKNTLDNYALFQLLRASIICDLAKPKKSTGEDKNSLLINFNSIKSLINEKFGSEYFDFYEMIGIYNKKDYEKSDIPYNTLLKISKIITNIHPKELNSSISAFIIGNYECYKKYDLKLLEIHASDIEAYKIQYKTVFNLLKIIQRMKKYKDKSRLYFFMEFQNDKNNLDYINIILKSLNKAPLLNLDDEYQDKDLMKEYINFLKDKNTKLSTEKAQLESDLEIKKEEINKLNNKQEDAEKIINNLNSTIYKLRSTLAEKRKEIKRKNNLNTIK